MVPHVSGRPACNPWLRPLGLRPTPRHIILATPVSAAAKKKGLHCDHEATGQREARPSNVRRRFARGGQEGEAALDLLDLVHRPLPSGLLCQPLDVRMQFRERLLE